MKYVRTLAALLYTLVLSPALAQWQVPQGDIPIGRGGGAQGFSSTTVPALLGTQATFSTLAAAAAAVIDPAVNTVTTLGRVDANDNGGASYIRIGVSTPAAWRFQSADGQWWALNNRVVTPEIFGCFNGQDCTAAFQSLATWINLGGVRGAVVNFFPNAAYKIWPMGTTPSVVLYLTGVSSVVFNFNGAKITTDNTFSPQGTPYVFNADTSNDLYFNDPSYEQTGYLLPLSFTRGGNFLTFSAPSNTGIHIRNMKQKGGVLGLSFGNSDFTLQPSKNITLLGATFENVYYPMNFRADGDNFFARGVVTTNCGRSYFPYNVSTHDVEVISNGGPSAHDNTLLKVYAYPTASAERNSLSDITMRYRNAGQDATNNLPTLTSLEFQQVVPPMTVSGAANNGSGKVRLTVDSTANAVTGQTWFFSAVVGTTEANGKNIITVVDATHVDLTSVAFVNPYTSGGTGRVPSTMKNIKLFYDVNDLTGNGQPPAIITRKYTYDSVSDTGTDGYTMENVQISGTLKNYNGGTSALNLFTNDGLPNTVGTWTGENVRDIVLRDLHIGGTNATATVNATALTSLYLENINSTSTVSWTLTDPSNVARTANVSATGLTDRRTVVPGTASAHSFFNSISAATGAFGSAQPSTADLSTAVNALLAGNGSTVGAYGGTSCTNQFVRSLSALGVATCSSVNLNLDVTGTLQAAQEPAHTGDVTNTAGSLALSYANVVPASKGGAGTITGALKGNGSGTVSQAACADLSNGATGCSTAIGTSGATIGLLNAANTWSATQAFAAITATSFNGMTITTSTGTFTLINGKTLAVNNSLTLSGNDGSTINFAAWTSFTPTITSGAGTCTSCSATGKYKLVDKTLWVDISVTVTTVGTASGALNVTLPGGNFSLNNAAIAGKELNVTGKMVAGYVGALGSVFDVRYYDGSNIWPSGNGQLVVFSGVLEIQ